MVNDSVSPPLTRVAHTSTYCYRGASSRARLACGLFDEFFHLNLTTHTSVTASIDIRHKRIPGTPEIFIKTS